MAVELPLLVRKVYSLHIRDQLFAGIFICVCVEEVLDFIMSFYSGICLYETLVLLAVHFMFPYTH